MESFVFSCYECILNFLLPGAKIAQYAGRHLHKHVVKTAEYTEGRIEEALRQAFLKIDQTMMDDEDLMDELSGTTAVVALLKNNNLYVVKYF